MSCAKPVVVSVTCDWTRRDTYGVYWETACGHAVPLADGSPTQAGMRFCCYCGGLLREREAK
jgi:hypothetical protein